jgi:hypothetical protein
MRSSGDAPRHITAYQFGRINDRILFCAVKELIQIQSRSRPYSEEQLARFKHVDSGGRFKARES